MPVTKSAKKKLRQDKRRLKQNLLIKDGVKDLIKEFKKKQTPEVLAKVFSALDKGTKKKIFHKNKSQRLKSRLSRLISNKKEKKLTVNPKKKPSQKS